MAKFETNTDSLVNMIKGINNLANNEQVFNKLLEDGAEIMRNEIAIGASEHKERGLMASSVKTTKIREDKHGYKYKNIRFTGSEGRKTTKSGKKYDITNWLKALRIEYGTSKQLASPFVRPAVQRAKPKISSRWKEIFSKEIKKLQ